MISASHLVLTAASFFGLRAASLAESMTPGEEADELLDIETGLAPSADLLSPGELYFEAVADELRRTGHLDG